MGSPFAVWRAGVAILLAALATAAPAQYLDDAPPPPATAVVAGERPVDALGRYVRILAQRPQDYAALIGAGRAALDTGDPEAAIGFFGRAADVSPNASAPHAGIGSAMVAMGEASDALPEFTRAQRLGASVLTFAAERGLARDLLGQQLLAQSDYRLALAGPNAAEARRRLALSLAISGNSAAALATLSPLLQRSDVATNRARAFVLALGGDSAAAGRALDTSVPGMSRSLEPFFRRLSALSPAQKAAAVHLGIMPGGQQQLASGAAGNFPSPGDRLASIDALLRPPGAPPTAQQPVQQATTVRVASIRPPSPGTAASAPRRLWVELASGLDEASLARQFARMATREPDLFQGIRPYVVQVGGRSKLLVGPFHSARDSNQFIENLADVQIGGFGWTSDEGQIVSQLDTP